MQPTTSDVHTEGLPARATGASPASGLVPDLFRIARRLRRSGGPAQIDVAALMLLHRLACDGAMRPSDLAADASLDLSTVSRHIKALDDAGLIARNPDPDDGRSYRLSLTPKGSNLMLDALRRRERSLDRVLAQWDSDDVSELRRLLGRLADDLDDIDEETP